MTIRTASALALVAGLGLAACDNSEYEEQISGLQTQLDSAQGEVGELRTQLSSAEEQLGEFETMGTELEEARARIEELEARPEPGEVEELRTELEAARARVEELESQDAAPADRASGEIEELRTELEQARARIEELEGGAEFTNATETSLASPSAGGANPTLSPVAQPLSGAITALREVDQQLQQLEDTLVGEGLEEVDLAPARTRLEAAGQSIAEAAQAAGVELEALNE